MCRSFAKGCDGRSGPAAVCDSRPRAAAYYNDSVTELQTSDLSELERVLLALLGAGLAPSSVANDPSFRLDVLSATTLALLRGLPGNAYLTSTGEATAELRAELTSAVYDLADRRVLDVGAPPIDVFPSLESVAAPGYDRSVQINFDQHPAVFDRFLAGRCLDELLRDAGVYTFVMGKYAESSEVWQRVYRQFG
jgi:hypothetical protein